MYTLLLCFWPLLQFIYSNSVNCSLENKDRVTRNIVAFSNAFGTLMLGITHYYTQSDMLFNLCV